MKRALAIALLIAAMMPAASLLASAFACHSMPCCAKQEAVKITTGCCQPAITSTDTQATIAKSRVLNGAPPILAAQVSENASTPGSPLTQLQSSPPRAVRLRLASLSTLLI